MSHLGYYQVGLIEMKNHEENSMCAVFRSCNVAYMCDSMEIRSTGCVAFEFISATSL